MPDIPNPAFTIHAGDVIYYDFPKAGAGRSSTAIGKPTVKAGSKIVFSDGSSPVGRNI